VVIGENKFSFFIMRAAHGVYLENEEIGKWGKRFALLVCVPTAHGV
jgi:hypothetical protein